MPEPIDPRIRRWLELAGNYRHLMRYDHSGSTSATDTAAGLELLAKIYTRAETNQDLANTLARIEGKATVTRLDPRRGR
ncbi:MAG: hypothetical protein AAGA68_27445 [Pseudomonadota bacterium]